MQETSLVHSDSPLKARGECPLCPDTLDKSDSPFDRILWRDKSGFIVPAVGMMLEGYFLGVTWEHYSSVAQSPPNVSSTFYEWMESVLSDLAPQFGQYLIFEHGACETSSSGACLDHAHVHLVPAADNFSAHLLLDESMQWAQIDSPPSLSQYKDRGYVSLWVDGQMWVAADQPVPSQWMRRRLAGYLGREVWDWAVDSNQEVLERTLDRLSVRA